MVCENLERASIYWLFFQLKDEGKPIERGVSNFAVLAYFKIDVARKGYNGASNGNVYNLNAYFLEDAKRRNNGPPETARSETWFACLFA